MSAVIAPAVALYSLALSRGARARAVAALAAVVAIVAIPILIADLHRIRHANLALLKERVALAERTREQDAQRRAQEEHLAIAHDLHDVVAGAQHDRAGEP